MLSTLDIFILALISDKIDNAYQWQRKANLSTGASLPSVRRLLDLGLVREAETGPRGRRRFTLTLGGRRELENVPQYLETACRRKLSTQNLFSGWLRWHKLAAKVILPADYWSSPH